jgi:hypothetical protein
MWLMSVKIALARRTNDAKIPPIFPWQPPKGFPTMILGGIVSRDKDMRYEDRESAVHEEYERTLQPYNEAFGAACRERWAKNPGASCFDLLEALEKKKTELWRAAMEKIYGA